MPELDEVSRQEKWLAMGLIQALNALGMVREPQAFVDYLLRNELTHFQGRPSTRARQEKRQQKLIHRLELLQARFEGNRLLY